MSSKTNRKSVEPRIENLAEDVRQLAEYVKWRKIPQAMALVNAWLPRLQTIPLSPEVRKDAIALLAYCAWGIYFDGQLFDQVKSAVARFKQELSKDLTRGELAYLAIAEGLLEFHQEHYPDAELLFKTAQNYADEAEDQELMIVSRYYRGRALSKQRTYDKALELINDAIQRDLRWNRNDARVAAMESVQHWLLFLKGHRQDARLALESARERLGSEEDYLVDRGNIVAALGRYHLQAGEYQQALDCFSEAICIYGEHNQAFRNIPRTRINRAFALRLMARDLGEHRPRHENLPNVAKAVENLEKFHKLQLEAFAELELAAEIYKFDQDRGMHFHEVSKLHSIRALLHFDRCEMRQAETEAENAFKIAEKGGDNVGMANARSIQSKLALDGDIKGYVDAPGAREFARQAISYAEKTENRRAIARAYMHAARALTSSPGEDSIEAERMLKKAQKHLVAEDRDYLRTSITALEKVIDNCSRRRHSLPVSSITIGYLEECIAERLSLNDIRAEHEERISRWVYKHCEGPLKGRLQKTVDKLGTSKRKVNDAISFFEITGDMLNRLANDGVSADVLARLTSLKNRPIQGKSRFTRLLKRTLKNDQTKLSEQILEYFARSH